MYVQHHLRSESELAMELARNLENCRMLGVDLHVLDLGQGSVQQVKLQRKGGVEDAARHLRYEALYTECKKAGCEYLATAHNADDQLETTLMKLFQAASISALEGIRPLRPANEGSLILIRPVLGCTHAELADYVASEGMLWSEDSSNREDRYLRNAIRHAITPPILQAFNGAYDAIAVMTKRFAEAGQLLQILTDEALVHVLFSPSKAVFFLDWFQSLAPALRELALFRIAVQQDGHNRISNSFIQRLRYELESSGQLGWWTLESGSLLFKLDGNVCTCTSVEQPYCRFCLPLRNPGTEQTLDLGNDVLFSIRPYDVNTIYDSTLLVLDATQLDCAVLRCAQLSDEICLEGGTVKVTKLLTSYKIPKHLHPTVVVLADRSGLVAVFARHHGGRDRLAKRFKAPLAHGFTNIYSSSIRNDCSEIENRQPRERFGKED